MRGPDTWGVNGRTHCLRPTDIRRRHRKINGEGRLCGALSLCVTSALDVVGLPVSISPFVGGIVGFVGVDKLREITN